MVNAIIRPGLLAMGTVIMALLAGCAALGPKMMHNARIEYNDVFADSWNKQLLLNLVRAKYGEPPLFLELGSLTTQYSIEAGAAVNPLWTRPDAVTDTVTRAAGTVAARSTSRGPGSGDEYKHGVTASYYERPTATFSPLQGHDYVTRLMSPIPLESLVLLTASGWSIERVLSMCAQRINGVPNAPSASGPTPSYAPKYENFARAVALLREMQVDDHFTVEISGEPGKRSMTLVMGAVEEHPRADEVRELLNLPEDLARIAVRPAWVGGDDDNTQAELVVQTRSLMGVFNYLANAVEVPEQDVKAGWVVRTRTEDGEDFDWKRVVGKVMCIHSSETPPSEAYVSVRHKGHWFYVAESDLNSKFTFSFLANLFYLQSGDSKGMVPLLTLPVSQ
jgi:hypothetical protein